MSVIANHNADWNKRGNPPNLIVICNNSEWLRELKYYKCFFQYSHLIFNTIYFNNMSILSFVKVFSIWSISLVVKYIFFRRTNLRPDQRRFIEQTYSNI